MKKIIRALSLSALAMLVAPALSGCSSAEENGVIRLRVFNCEDYIGESELSPFWEEAEEETYADVISAFEAWEKEVNGKNVRVIYDTFDTNETMLSSLKTGKTNYDLVCPSDYTIQKMMAQGMLEPYDVDATPNYDAYASPYLVEVLDSITAQNGDGTGEEYPISAYSRGYMWGTLGILYNPAKVAADKGLEEDEVKFDMGDWASCWDPKYKSEMSIKDSMRDTYSVGIMKLFGEEIEQNLQSSGYFEEGNYALKEGAFEEAVWRYSPLMSDIFNRADEKTVQDVEKVLLDLKGNVFGFEVDSGKDDMVKGMIGMNLAWSGDAVYSMDRGENEADNYIYYSIPKTGGNIWFDGWVMPKSDSLHKEEAQEFVDFLSHPDIASANMDTIGYTSFIAGDTILDLIRSWYDPRSFAMYVWHDATGADETWEDSDFLYDENDELVYQDGTGVHENGDDYGELDMTGSTYEEAVVNGVAMSWEEYQAYYNENVAESEDDMIEWGVRNLTYMFEGTLEELAVENPGDTPDTNPYLFYTDEIEEIESPYGDDYSLTAGRQFFAQYPEEELIPKLAIMRDYGTNNKYVLAMWQNVKGNNLPLWGAIVFGVILLSGLAMILAFLIGKYRWKKIKIARRKEASASLSKAK